MLKTHILGLPRIDKFREIKFIIEDYWKDFSEEKKRNLIEIKKNIYKNNWNLQVKYNLDYITVGDFSYYDHILDFLVLIKCVPNRFNINYNKFELTNYFDLTKGNNKNKPMEMKKWFNTNYHYMVPEYTIESKFSSNIKLLLDDIELAKNENKKIKVVLIGLLSILKLGKIKDKELKNKLVLIPNLILTYINIINKLNFNGVSLIQIDEPILNFNLSKCWIKSFKAVYSILSLYFSNILLTTYFGEIKNYFNLLNNIPLLNLHIDCVDNNQVEIFKNLNNKKILSIGIIDGKNIWKNNIELSYYKIKNINFNKRDLYLSCSCSLMHSPLNLNLENIKIKNWLSFGEEKLKELKILKSLFDEDFKISKEFIKYIYYIEKIKNSKIKINNEFQILLKNLNKYDFNLRKNFNLRNYKQNYNLPILPITNIGSFPQTNNIRRIRLRYKKKLINNYEYENLIKKEINYIIKKQLEYGFDVLVHGEPERNDMVEYFSNFFKGISFTNNGWIQSYGTRYVKPPIIYSDICRNKENSNDLIFYSQELTNKLVKGVLTGPLTILKWSFYRKDQPSYITSLNISLVIKNEILDLEKNNIKIIQIDEPAIREFLPFKKNYYYNYFNWTSKIILLSFNKVKDETQIHSHICYSEFNNIIKYINNIDFDVISIETYRSNLDILKFVKNYNNEIGLGLYDIHSKRKLNINECIYYIKLIILYININKIWINPDCGLKTRSWKEIEESLCNLNKSVTILRNYYLL